MDNIFPYLQFRLLGVHDRAVRKGEEMSPTLCRAQMDFQESVDNDNDAKAPRKCTSNWTFPTLLALGQWISKKPHSTGSVAALQPRDLLEGGNGESIGSRMASNDFKSYSKFQFAKLKGFCCMWSNCSLPPIWDYLKSTKDTNTQWIRFIEKMMTWDKQHVV